MCVYVVMFFFKQKTAYELRISDWSSDVCSSDLLLDVGVQALVDEAALLVIDIVAGQRAEKIIIERRAARRTTVGGRPVQLLHHLGDRAHILRDDLAAGVVVAEARSFAHRFGPALQIVAHCHSEQIFYEEIGVTEGRGRGREKGES